MRARSGSRLRTSRRRSRRCSPDYTVTEYKEGIELVPVVARAIPEERLGLGVVRGSHYPDALGRGRSDLAGGTGAL